MIVSLCIVQRWTDKIARQANSKRFQQEGEYASLKINIIWCSSDKLTSQIFPEIRKPYNQILPYMVKIDSHSRVFFNFLLSPVKNATLASREVNNFNFDQIYTK